MSFRENMPEIVIHDLYTGELVATTFALSGQDALRGFAVATGYAAPDDGTIDHVHGSVDEWTMVYENTELVAAPKGGEQ